MQSSRLWVGADRNRAALVALGVALHGSHGHAAEAASGSPERASQAAPTIAAEPQSKDHSGPPRPAQVPIAARFGAFAPSASKDAEPARGRDEVTGPEPGPLGRGTQRAGAASTRDTPVDVRNDCNHPPVTERDFERCYSRTGTFTGMYLGLDAGFATPKSTASDRVGFSAGPAFALRLGMELWDMLVIGIGFHFFDFGDRRPISEYVVDCTYLDNVKVGCDSEPHEASSTVFGLSGSLEAGYQKRFAPSRSLSISLGALGGYMQGFGHLKRGVECEGCTASGVAAIASGLYAVPFVRLTFGRTGEYALIARNQWFVTGDLLQTTMLGFELGAP